MEKQCFKCKETKPISNFYAHPAMGDGHLNKCITCAKRDVFENIKIKKQNPEWVAKERARCREKQIKYRLLGLAFPVKQESREKWAEKNNIKILAQRKAANAKRSGLIKKPNSCKHCGIETDKLQMHHHDYSKPLDVWFLCTKCHGIEHRKDKHTNHAAAL